MNILSEANVQHEAMDTELLRGHSATVLLLGFIHNYTDMISVDNTGRVIVWKYTRCVPFSSDRLHLSYDDCLEVRGKIIISSVLYCELKLCTVMSSSYSSLDWFLSHWAHFTVPGFLCLCIFCVVLSYCICVVLL